MKTIYLISGPLGVGKTSISEALFKAIDRGALVTGDNLYNLEEDQILLWEEKLQKAWEKILSATRHSLVKHPNVVVDFVVEDELPWFRKQLSDQDVQFKYVVLIADKETILERLKKRNELKYKDRSMALLNQLSKDPGNQKYILETTDKEIPEIVQEITDSARFIVG